MEGDTVSKKRLTFKQWFFIIWFLIMITGASFAVVTYGSFWRFDYNTKITDFSICSGLDSNGYPIPSAHPITLTAKEINVCGYLEGNVSNIRLAFNLQFNGKLVVNPMSSYYQVGYFTTRIAAPSNGFKAGNYLVLVYQGRHKLASTEFTIRKP